MLGTLGRPLEAKQLLSQRQALALAFGPGAVIERHTVFLNNERRQAAQEAGRVKIDSGVWTYYIGRSSCGVGGYAYFDTHVVRTMPESFMAVLEPDGAVRSVEILSFLEPEDYMPGRRWLKQFTGKSLSDDLLLHRGVRNLSGASLTSQALADGLRRILAVHAAVRQGEMVKSLSP